MKKTVYIVAHWSKWSKEFQHDIVTFRPGEDSEFVLVCERELEFETLGEQALKQGAYNGLMAKRKKILADAYAEAVELEAQANELLAIDFKADKVEASDDVPF